MSGGCRRESPEADPWYDNFRRSPPDARVRHDVGAAATRRRAPMSAPVLRRIIIWPITAAGVPRQNAGTISMPPENIMKVWTPRLACLPPSHCAARRLALRKSPRPDAPRGATHDCSGMTGTALATCQQLNRNVNEPAPSGAGTPNDCSGMTGAPLASCRRLNAAETVAPTSSAGASEDCSGQVGDALKACRALNGQPTEYDVSTGGAATHRQHATVSHFAFRRHPGAKVRGSKFGNRQGNDDETQGRQSAWRGQLQGGAGIRRCRSGVREIGPGRQGGARRGAEVGRRRSGARPRRAAGARTRPRRGSGTAPPPPPKGRT